MTDNRTTELLPCPFCGKANTLKIQKPKGRYTAPDNYFVVCDVKDDGCGASGGIKRTDAEAIAAWNTRAERTCKPTEPERCLDGTDCPAWLCSECGELFELGANFCSNCGAKVVGV
jgi:Lar family restriction alleviation protein